jgi:MYXO-CTERM domain-containing protein
MFEGLTLSVDHGCDWHLSDGVLKGKVIIDTVVRRESPKSALVLSTVYAGENDAGVRYATQIYATTDNGATWAAYGAPLVEDARVETLEVAASDPHRVYVSGVRGSGPGSVSTLFVSMDDGATWMERPIPTEKNAERAPFLAAVDPMNADRVYVRTESDVGSRLLVSDNAGMSFTNPFKGVGAMLGFALSPDGSKIFLGGPDDGLYTATKADLAFTKRSPIHVQCLATEGKTLFACSDENSGFLVGSSEDDGVTFAPKLHVYGLRGPLACPPATSAAACAPQWPPLRDALAAGAPDAGDAGETDAGPEPSADSTGGGGCSCSLGPSDTVTLASGVALAAIVLAALRRRSRSR